MRKRFLTYDTDNRPSNVDEKGMLKEKEPYHIEITTTNGTDWSLVSGDYTEAYDAHNEGRPIYINDQLVNVIDRTAISSIAFSHDFSDGKINNIYCVCYALKDGNVPSFKRFIISN